MSVGDLSGLAALTDDAIATRPLDARPALARAVFCALIAFGAFFVFVVPPIQPPDEDSHFTRAVMISEGSFLAARQGSGWGQNVPVSLRDYVVAHSALQGHSERKYSYDRWYADSYMASAREPRVQHFYSALPASPLLYLPQVAGILAGKVIYRVIPYMSFSWPAALYFARLGNLVAFGACLAFAIAIAPALHSVLAFVALMPMSLSLAASASYDVTAIGACVVFIAMLLAAAGPERPTGRQWIVLVVSAFFVGHAKAVYAPLVLCAVVLKEDRSWPEFLRLGSALVGASALGLVATLLIARGVDDPSQAAAFAAQTRYLLEHLLWIPTLIADTFAARGQFYVTSAAAEFGSLDTNLPLPAVATVWALFVLAIVTDALTPQNRLLGWAARLCILVACAASVTLLMLVIYVRWTSVQPGLGIGAPVADGVQGRYFIPLLVPLAVAVSFGSTALSRAAAEYRPTLLAVQLAASKALLAVASFAIVLRYYIPAPAP
jgi:uncharacterized membrane protein